MSTYDTADPRAALSKQKSAVPPPVEFAAAEYAKFYETAPQDDDQNGKTWYARGQNFIIAYTEAKPGATFIKIGVGVLRKVEGTYNRYFLYEVVDSGKSHPC